MIECGLVRHVKDLFDLTATDLLKIEGFAAKSASNLLKELQKARSVNDYQLLASMNIPGIGINIARQLLKEHSIDEIRNMTLEELSGFPGIGPERAAAICGELASQSVYLDELLNAVDLITSDSVSPAGKTVCFTGKMPEKRSYYEKLALDNGFQPVDDVSSKLSLLVAADPAASGGKLNKAAKAGVKTISLDEFLELISTPAEDDGAAPEKEGAIQGELF